MRTTFDFTPFFQPALGLDRMLNDVMEVAARIETSDDWPQYDLIKEGEDSYRITMAVAGFSLDDLTLTQNRNVLTIAGERAAQKSHQYLHRGIPVGRFERRFRLGDHVKVGGAQLRDGLLTVMLRREVPEELRPRRIEITSVTESAPVQQRLTTDSANKSIAEVEAEAVERVNESLSEAKAERAVA